MTLTFNPLGGRGVYPSILYSIDAFRRFSLAASVHAPSHQILSTPLVLIADSYSLQARQGAELSCGKAKIEVGAKN